MPDTTIKKVESKSSPRGDMGQKYLVAGKRVSMRLWVLEPGGELKAATSREYETVGYVISGSARLDLEGQTLNLKAGDSWLVPAGTMHQYTILEPFIAVEATAPPAEIHGRDEAVSHASGLAARVAACQRSLERSATYCSTRF
jgi:quercetin dioxygenase-like cupin family protein